MKSFALKKSYGMPIYYNKVFIYYNKVFIYYNKVFIYL